MTQKKEKLSRWKKFELQIMFYLLFVLLNIVGNRLVRLLDLPLFIDNTGTLLAAVWGGYLPGIVVGYLTNLINATADPANAYYAVLSVLIAVSGTFLGRKGFFDRFYKALLTIPVFAFIGGCIGSILTYLMYGYGMGEGISAPFALALLKKGTLSVFWAQMISDVAIDLADKAVTVIIVYLLMKVLPKKVASSLALTDWRQKPLTEEETGEARKAVVRGRSLRGKIILIIGTVMVFIAFVTTAISYVLHEEFAIEQYKNTGKNAASLVAATLDPERIGDYLERGADAEDYIDTMERLYRIKASSPDIAYLYVYQILPDGCHVVFDLDTEELEGGAPGEVIPFDESFAELIPDLLSGNAIAPIITDDTYGWLLTDYEPVYDAQGGCVCYACVDINMRDVTLNGISFLAKVLSLFIGFFILILVLCMWLADYHLTYPIDAMTLAARNFAYNSEEAREVSVERLKSLDISTGDELENLYDSLSKTISETVGYIEEVQRKGEEIARMQNGLIYIMADLVESRDKCTGDHVRKTAAYVKLIVELLQKEQLYPEIVDDRFVRDVCNSAPLHDVGKIKVSDLILNKPARLTDEEFEEMKKHTTAGQEIIESAMKLTSDSGYLKEALNLATYHHEKWDGSGYPKGLKGEEIPLSARIMAVSDVFDALVSERSYKKPFTFEQAMNIIKEGAGTHFDPIIAKVFVDHEEQVRRIAEEHQRRGR